MRRYYGWVVVLPEGNPLIFTTRRTRGDAIDAWAGGPHTWPRCYRAGYRCVKVELRLVEQPKRKGGGR